MDYIDNEVQKTNESVSQETSNEQSEPSLQNSDFSNEEAPKKPKAMPYISLSGLHASQSLQQVALKLPKEGFDSLSANKRPV